eukprot:scaffold35351_cov18-Phaeocystis_antarctica.AAC.1
MLGLGLGKKEKGLLAEINNGELPWYHVRVRAREEGEGPARRDQQRAEINNGETAPARPDTPNTSRGAATGYYRGLSSIRVAAGLATTLTVPPARVASGCGRRQWCLRRRAGG